MARSLNRPNNTGAWQRAVAIVKSRDSDCGICHQELHPELPYPHPLSTSVDHIIPLAIGGAPVDPNNLRATHLHCNLHRRRPRRTTKRRTDIAVSRPRSRKW